MACTYKRVAAATPLLFHLDLRGEEHKGSPPPLDVFLRHKILHARTEGKRDLWRGRGKNSNVGTKKASDAPPAFFT